MTPARTPAVSVVVPTYRRPELLRRCLRRLLAQQLPGERFEIVVVDDGRDDATWQVVDDDRRHLNPGEVIVNYVRPARGRGPAVARNAGWREACGEVIAFTDDDTLPEPDWLARGLAALREHEAWAGLSGRVVVPLAEASRRRPTDHELMTLGLERAEFVTANAFVRREALQRVGGFDERFTRAWREDSDLQFRLMREVGPVGRGEDAVVLHPARAERWGVCLRQQRNALFEALLFKKHRALYRQRIETGPPWLYYGVVGAALLTVGAAAAGSVALAGLAGAAALGGAFTVAARRLRATSHALPHVAEMIATSLVIPFLSVYWRLRGALRFRVLFF